MDLSLWALSAFGDLLPFTFSRSAFPCFSVVPLHVVAFDFGSRLPGGPSVISSLHLHYILSTLYFQDGVLHKYIVDIMCIILY